MEFSEAQNKKREHLPPDLVHEQTGVVTTPVTAGPAGTLVEKLDVIFEGGLDLTLGLVLDPGLPIIRYQPSRDKIIVICIQLIASPAFSLEAIQKQRALKNLRAKGTCAS